jgi:excisionase family DNA binding protein
MIQTRELLLVRTNGGSICSSIDWCPECRQMTEWITADEAAALRNVSTRIIFRWIENNSVHFNEVGGRVLLCATALPLSRS